jgi:copper(I)-binding protein
MRLRTLIELLVALMLTFAAVVAISKMARATGVKVETACSRVTIGEAKTGAVYMTLNKVGSEPGWPCSAATDAAARGLD